MGLHQNDPYPEVATAPGALDGSMAVLGRVATLLDATATPAEATGYKDWLMDIARAIARAGKEDQGFLGHGGVMVNDAERQALAAIARTLRLEARQS